MYDILIIEAWNQIQIEKLNSFYSKKWKRLLKFDLWNTYVTKNIGDEKQES